MRTPRLIGQRGNSLTSCGRDAGAEERADDDEGDVAQARRNLDFGTGDGGNRNGHHAAGQPSRRHAEKSEDSAADRTDGERDRHAPDPAPVDHPAPCPRLTVAAAVIAA